jgi:hypothetical protein
VGDGAGEGGTVRGAIGGAVGGVVRSTVGDAMSDTRRGAVRSRAISGGMASVGGRYEGVGAGTRARSEDAVVGKLRHGPHLNGVGPRVVWSGRGRGSGGLVALVPPLVLVIASVMRVSTPLLPPACTGRRQTAGRRRECGTLGDEGRGRGVGG